MMVKKEASLTGWEMPDNSVFTTTPGKGGTDTENEEKGSFRDIQADVTQCCTKKITI